MKRKRALVLVPQQIGVDILGDEGVRDDSWILNRGGH